MSKTKNKPGIHLYKGVQKKWNRKKGYSVFVPSFYWHIVARNGRIIARSSETYTRKSGAVKSIKVALSIFQDSLCVKGVYKAYYDHSKSDSPLQSYL